MKNKDNVSKIGLGLGYGGQNALNFTYGSKHIKVIKAFLTQGGTFIDTSPDYGNGTSERIIGKLPKYLREKIFISTKVSPKNLKYDSFIKSTIQSLKRLKVKKINVIQPHWPNYSVHNDEIISAYLELKKRSIVDFFGLSNFSLKDIRYFKKKLKNNFLFIQERFSLGNAELLEEKIKYCKKNNICIIVYSPFKTGDLHFEKSHKVILKNLCKKYKIELYGLILAYILKQIKNSIILTYTSKIKNIKSNIEAEKLSVDDRDIKLINNKFKIKFKTLKLKEICYQDKSYDKIKSLEDALKVTDTVPTPSQLAERIRKGYKLENIILKKINKKYFIKQGRFRFWANVIAYGWNKKIIFELNA